MKILDLKISPASEGELELVGELGVEEFNNFRSSALKSLGEEVKIDGFRPGHIPEKVLLEQVGEDKVLWEMANLAIATIYPEILRENKIPALGRPAVTITKIAKDNPLGFKIKTAVMPEIKLGDYREIALSLSRGKTSSEPEVLPPITDEDVAKIFDQVKKQHEGHNHSDEELKKNIRENLELEQKTKLKDKKRVKIVEEIIKQSEIKIANLLIENEKDKMLAEMEAQIGYMGLKFDDYLIQLKKTREELRGGWGEQARGRVAFGLVLGEIAQQEKIEPPADELKNEIDYLKSQYKDVAEERLRAYASSLIVNEKVFEFLENLK